MTEHTRLSASDLSKYRSHAQRVLGAQTLARHTDLLQDVTSLRDAVTTMREAVLDALGGDLDPVTRATVEAAEEIADRRAGTGLQSTDDLARALARSVLLLVDTYELV